MSPEQPVTNNPVPPRRQIAGPLRQLSQNQALSVIGLPELIGLIGAAALAVMVVFAYLYFYLPANSKRVATELDRKNLQAQLQSERDKVKTDDNTSERVLRINASVEDFESNWLALQNPGRMSLYAVLNNLIKTNGLRNTAGPSYAPLEVVGAKTQGQASTSAEKQTAAKWQSIYPGLSVSVTVEGLYPNVRHFVRDIETSRQFLIINAIELESVKQSGAAQEQSLSIAPPSQPRSARNPKGGTATATAPPAPEIAGGRGGLVSLRLDLATYFQRPDNKATPAN